MDAGNANIIVREFTRCLARQCECDQDQSCDRVCHDLPSYNVLFQCVFSIYHICDVIKVNKKHLVVDSVYTVTMDDLRVHPGDTDI